MDAVRMITYRAETAMVTIVRNHLCREDDARSLIRDLVRSPADIRPDLDSGQLRIDIHSFANARSNWAIASLLEELKRRRTELPGTQLRLVYSLLGSDEQEKPAN